MDFVLTLICDPARPILQQSLVAANRRALAGGGAATGEPRFLAPGIACDIPFEGLSCRAAEEVVRTALGAAPVDAAAQPESGRRKRMLAADMDATIIENEIVDEIAAQAGLRDRIAPITERAVRGEIAFAEALALRVSLMAGLPEARYVMAREAIRVTPGARALVSTMRAHGARTVIISGGFHAFTSYVRDLVGFDAEVANEVEIADGKLTGRLVPPVVDRDSKVAMLRDLARSWNIPLADCLAVGDGANDVGMVAAAGLGVAFRGKPVLRRAAAVAIDHGDLSALLYLQGYRAEEIRS